MKRPTRRRTLFTVFASLFLGAVTTVAIAWRCAYIDFPDNGFEVVRQVFPADPAAHTLNPNYPPGSLTLIQRQTFGSMKLNGEAIGTGVDEGRGIPALFLRRRLTGVTPEQTVPRWAASAVLPWTCGRENWPRPTDEEFRTVDARGWPCLALYCGDRAKLQSTVEFYGGIRLPVQIPPSSGGVPRARSIVLPYLPIWRGFIANTAVFGSGWMVVLSSPWIVRSCRRHRKDACPSCGYNLVGLPSSSACPECGGRQSLASG